MKRMREFFSVIALRGGVRNENPLGRILLYQGSLNVITDKSGISFVENLSR